MKTSMKARICALMVCAVGLPGCVTSYSPDIQTHRSPFERQRTDFIVDNLLESSDQAPDRVWLNASRVFKDSYDFSYYLEVTYATTTDLGFLDIGLGPTLVVVADGKEMQFTGSGSVNLHKQQGALLNETALYRVEGKDLIAIGNARQVKVRIIGRQRIVEREFSTLNLARFKKFADEFVSPTK
jgi:hypothetical protein